MLPPNDNSETPQPPNRSMWPRVLLGLFVVWQLGFMLITNIFSLVPPPPTEDDLGNPLPEGSAAAQMAERARAVCIGWAGLTLQRQNWLMFRGAPSTAIFPAVRLEMRNPGSAVALRARVEPDDPHSYFVGDFLRDRLWTYEAHLVMIYLPWDEDKVVREDPRVQRERRGRAWYYSGPLQAYLRLRRQEFQEEHSQSPPPEALVLFYRVYRTATPAEGIWRVLGPIERDMVRWPSGEGPLEVYNPRTRQFEPLKDAP